MKTHLSLPTRRSDALPDHVDNDVRTPAVLVEQLVEAFTDPGETVLDPFAGFGTTLTVAERLGRVAYGVEVDADRATFVRERIADPENLVHGDVFDLDAAFPPADCCLTSPPYIGWAEGVDPFRNYDPDSETTYEDYLNDIVRAFEHVAGWMAADATLVVDIANLKTEDGVVTLAWDVGKCLAETDAFDFRGEIVVTWDGRESDGRGGDDSNGAYGYGYDHSYCLVYDVEGGAR
ncbi:DNA methylase [Halogranum gelatinilyticum]|uniref:Type II methyltransferase n=1 Tax=Halogranum gelatinilyticum TaxID=660521 RepID=A0A1G9PP66_9EURY|nr:DNA methyltransferase [Halogranum gelatinilyticum]SDM00271.1 DNA methylase [Halogranum gelatinilyticum]